MKNLYNLFALVTLFSLSALSASAGVSSNSTNGKYTNRSMEVINHIQTAYTIDMEVASANVNNTLNDTKKLERTTRSSYDVQPILKDGIVKTYAPIELTAQN